MEDREYLQEKPSQILFANKKSKHGISARCSATLRKGYFTEARKNRDSSVVLKHVSFNEGWKPDEIEDSLLFDDGGLARHGCYLEKKRNKHSRSVIARHPNTIGSESMESSFVTYSMNKRKRWLLPETLKEEIHAGRVTANADIDVTVVERAVGFGENYFRPDVIDTVSTILPEKENFPKTKKRKTKRSAYSWSTDLLGLSQHQSETDFEEPKPEITYEFCHSRMAGPYVDQSLDLLCKNQKKYQRRQRKKIKVDEYPVETDLETESDFVDNDDATNNTNARQPLEIASWVNHAQNGMVVQHRLKSKKSRTQTATTSERKRFQSKKGRVISRKQLQVPQIQEKNKHNLLETIAADVHFENVLKAEQDASTVINVSLQSFFDVDSRFGKAENNNKDPAKMFGVNVWKSQSRPIKYAFQMEKQLPVKLTNGEVKSALAYLIVEPLFDFKKCQNKDCCFTQNGFCQCHPYHQTRLKLVIQSDEKRHQECLRVWKKKLDNIIKKSRPGCPGMYMEKIVKITSFTYNATAEEMYHETVDEKQAKQKKLFLFNEAPYKRKVMDKAYSLLGFSATAFDSEQIGTTETDANKEKQIIVNNNPKDFCEICWTELTEENEGFRATALIQCKHWFCHDCWRKHLTTGTRGAAPHSLKCPGYECEAVIDNVTLMAFLPGSDVWKYQNRKLKNAIKRSENFHHCPQCSATVEVKNRIIPSALKHAVPLSCICGMRWCSHCKEEPHWPTSCSAAELYRKEMTSRNTHNVIKNVSGRKCPLCHEVIEKNGGCQMVTCFCGHTFCWKCMKTFEECLYMCKNGTPELENWNITTKYTRFTQAMFEAGKSRKNYEATKTHRVRLASCDQTAKKEIATAQKTEDLTFMNKLQMTCIVKDNLHRALLHCNALHHVIQYLTIDVAFKRQTRNSHYPKLNRFLIRLKLFVDNIEISLFQHNPRRKIPLEQVLEKKISASADLLRFLAVYINRSNQSKMIKTAQ